MDEDGNPYLPNQPRPDGKTFYTDKSGGYFDDNTCGFEYSIGEIRFYCEDSYHPAANFVGTGNLEQNWRQHAFMFGNGCNSVTGVNPANPTSESNGVHIWEFLPVEGPAHRSMTRVWNCCDNPCRDKTAVAFGFPRERG